jgi:acyl-coenzyme A synthetase/AMP-(fatty) acid ligase
VSRAAGDRGEGAGEVLGDTVTDSARAAAYRRAGHWDATTLSGRVADAAARRSGRAAVIDRDGAAVHSYAELGRDVSTVAAWLEAQGVGAGDVVSIQLPNWYEFVVLAVATQAVGAVINPLLPIYRRKELLHAFTVAESKVVCTPAIYRNYDHLSTTAAVIEESGRSIVHVVVDAMRPAAVTGADGRTVWFDDLLAGHAGGDGGGGGAAGGGGGGAAGGEVPGPGGRWGAPEPDAVSELIFTSGTEAAPKAIMHTEQTANFSVRVAAEDLEIGDDDVVWMPSPIGHSTGFNYGVRFALYHGLPLVLQDRWDAGVACDLIAAHGASYTLASTTFLQDVVAEAERRGGRWLGLGSMTRFGCGGSPVPPELVRRAAACGIGVLRLYGSTEVLVATWNRPGGPVGKAIDTDGPALSSVEVEVRDENGSVSAPGVPGEIHIRGPNTCVGFYRDPARTAATFAPGGWVRSGDLATMDEDGYLTVVGRKKEIIIRGGLNITPREIEDLLLDFPEVDRAAVVGLPHERLGERVCACVVLAPGTDLDFETMVRRLRAIGLAAYKLPEQLEVLDALPVTASGKVQKFEIVHRLSGSSPSPTRSSQQGGNR